VYVSTAGSMPAVALSAVARVCPRHTRAAPGAALRRERTPSRP